MLAIRIEYLLGDGAPSRASNPQNIASIQKIATFTQVPCLLASVDKSIGSLSGEPDIARA